MMKSVMLDIGRMVTLDSVGARHDIGQDAGPVVENRRRRDESDEMRAEIGRLGEEVKALKLKVKQILRENEILQAPSYRKRAQRLARGM